MEEHLRANGIPFDCDVVTIRKDGRLRDYPHVYLDEDGIVVECTVYPRAERRSAPVSSITGRPMERASAKKLQRLIEGMTDSPPEERTPNSRENIKPGPIL